MFRRPIETVGLVAALTIAACSDDGVAAQDTDAGTSGGSGSSNPSTTLDPTSGATMSGTQSSTVADTSGDPATTQDDTVTDSSDSTGSESTTGDPPMGCAGASAYTVATATYLGGANGWEHARDVVIDGAGDIIMVGGTTADDFPTTAGAYDESWNTGGNQIGDAGQSDAFVAKFSAAGDLVWSTVLGGPNYDRAYAVEVDDAGDIYVGGRAGPGFPTSNGSFQPDFAGGDPGFYGQQNGFVAKLSADGSTLVWSSYAGIGALVRDLDVDDAGALVIKFGHNQVSANATSPAWLDAALMGAYQPTPTNPRDSGLAMLTTDGVPQWASWFGGAGFDSEEGSVRIDGAGRPVLAFNTDSNDLPTTPGVAGPSHNGGEDIFVAMLSPDGSDLVFGSYIGGSGYDGLETHALGVSDEGVYVMAMTDSDDLDITDGAVQSSRAGSLDVAVFRLDFEGALVASTYFGGTGGEGADGFSVTADGEVLFVGETNSTDLPVTDDAHQSTLDTAPDAYVVRLSSDLGTIRYATYLGGAPHDTGRGAVIGDDCTVVMVGAADGAGFPVVDPWQSDFAGGAGDFGNGDNIMAKLVVR
jgi:hypothetical protein